MATRAVRLNPSYVGRGLYRYLDDFVAKWAASKNVSLKAFTTTDQNSNISKPSFRGAHHLQETKVKIEPPHDKTNKMTVRPAKTQISLGIRPVWSESSLFTQWITKDPSFLYADSEDSDQTVGFVMRRLKLGTLWAMSRENLSLYF